MILPDNEIREKIKANRQLLQESKDLGDTYMKLPLDFAENLMDTLESLLKSQEIAK